MKTLVLDVPGLHVGYLGFYGNDWIATPNLDRLASQGVVFDCHFADNYSTLPEKLKIQSISIPDERLPAEKKMSRMVKKILDGLQEQSGIVWAEFPGLGPPWDFSADLLDAYLEEDEAPWSDPPQGLLKPNELQDLVRLQNTYAAVVTYFDAQVGRLIEELEKRHWLDETLLCVTSRIGLPLGEHGLVGCHRAWQHEELVHLPLLLRLPGKEEAGLRIGALTHPCDFAATLREYLRVPGPENQGQSLWPLIREEKTEIRSFVCSVGTMSESVEWALRTKDWAFLLPIATPPDDPPRGPQLYVKPEDRWEVNDVRQHHLELAEELEKQLREFNSIKINPS